MRGTQLLRRATQTLSNEDAARVVSAAAQRASANSKVRRPSWVRRNLELITIGAATLVAGSALKNRRIHDERMGLLEAELDRVKLERDQALSMVDKIKTTLVQDAASAVKVVDDAASGRSARAAAARTARLQQWMEEGIEQVLIKNQVDQAQGAAGEKPNLI